MTLTFASEFANLFLFPFNWMALQSVTTTYFEPCPRYSHWRDTMLTSSRPYSSIDLCLKNAIIGVRKENTYAEVEGELPAAVERPVM